MFISYVFFDHTYPFCCNLEEKLIVLTARSPFSKHLFTVKFDQNVEKVVLIQFLYRKKN